MREIDKVDRRGRRRERDRRRKRGTVDDSGGLGNRIVIIVYTFVFYELSVVPARDPVVAKPCGKRRFQWCARY